MLSFHFSSFVRHHCPTQILLTQILQNLGDANRKSNYATPLFCDNLLLADFFFFLGGGGGGEAGTSQLFSQLFQGRRVD